MAAKCQPENAWDASRLSNVLIGASRLVKELIDEKARLTQQIAALREELLSVKDEPRRRA